MSSPGEMEIVIVVEQKSSTEPPSYGLALHLLADALLLRVVELASGYRSPAEALSALVEALTYAAPDTATLEEQASRVPELIDAMRAANEAIQQLGDRLMVLEEQAQSVQVSTLRAALPPAKPAGRVPQSPAPLRRPGVISVGMRTGAGELTGGAFRPGGKEEEEI